MSENKHTSTNAKIPQSVAFLLLIFVYNARENAQPVPIFVFDFQCVCVHARARTHTHTHNYGICQERTTIPWSSRLVPVLEEGARDFCFLARRPNRFRGPPTFLLI